jgi:hypothetical protein
MHENNLTISDKREFTDIELHRSTSSWRQRLQRLHTATWQSLICAALPFSISFALVNTWFHPANLPRSISVMSNSVSAIIASTFSSLQLPTSDPSPSPRSSLRHKRTVCAVKLLAFLDMEIPNCALSPAFATAREHHADLTAPG